MWVWGSSIVPARRKRGTPPSHRSLTMALSTGRNVQFKHFTKLFSTVKLDSHQFRPRFTHRNMNTLQEGSRVYKAFKKGGPSFGAWQVRSMHSKPKWYHDTKVHGRCSQERIMLEPLLVQEWTGFASTPSTATLTARHPILSVCNTPSKQK